MDINKLTSDLVNMAPAQRDQMLMSLAGAFQKAGLLNATENSLGGVSDVMAYLTRQPVPLRGLRLLGVHAVECVRIKHPTKGIIIEIPKKDYDPEEHGPVVKKTPAVRALAAAPQEDEDDDDDDTDESVNSGEEGADDEEVLPEKKPVKKAALRKRGRK